MHAIFSRLDPKIGTTEAENFMCPRIQNCVKYVTLLEAKIYRLYIINTEQHAKEFIYLMTDMHLTAKHILCCGKLIHRILCKIWWGISTNLLDNITSSSHSQLHTLVTFLGFSFSSTSCIFCSSAAFKNSP